MGIWVHGCVAVWLRVHGVGDVCYTATRTSSASPAHDTIARKGKEGCNANQTHVYTDRTLDRTNTHASSVVVWAHAFVEQGSDFLCGGVYTISETKLGQSMPKDGAINRRTHDFCLCAFGAGRGRVRRVVLIGCAW